MSEQNDGSTSEAQAPKVPAQSLPVRSGSNQTRTPTRLETLIEEEDTALKIESPAHRGLITVFRAKHEEFREYARREHDIAREMTTAAKCGLYLAVAMVLIVWADIVCAISQGRSIPYPFFIATSGAVLFIIGAASLAFRVADRHSQRSLRYAEDADETRRAEAATRLVLTSGEQTRLADFAPRLLEAKSDGVEGELDASAIPELLKDVAEFTGKLADSAAKVLHSRK